MIIIRKNWLRVYIIINICECLIHMLHRVVIVSRIDAQNRLEEVVLTQTLDCS